MNSSLRITRRVLTLTIVTPHFGRRFVVYYRQDTHMEAYCVKCKTKREIQNPQPLFNSRGSPYTKGTCPVCGTNIMRLGMSELHAGMERPQKPVVSGHDRGDVPHGQAVV